MTVKLARWTACAMCLLVAVGCGTEGASPEQRAAVEAAVREYLDALSTTYAEMDPSALESHASPNEIQHVDTMLRTLAQGGDRLEARLLGIEFEAVEVFRSVNATVRLVEIWDVGRYDAFSGRETGRNAESIQSTLIQLRRVDGSWIVVGRSIMSQEEPDTSSEDDATPATGGLPP